MRFAYIEWIDAHQDPSGWKESHEIDDEAVTIHSVGMIAAETKEWLSLALDGAEDGMTNGRGKIPKVNIRTRYEVDFPKLVKWMKRVHSR